MKRIVVLAMLVWAVALPAPRAWGSWEVAPAAQQQREVDVDEVWPFWVALSGLVFAIGALSMWDTRRRRRGGPGTRAN